MADLIDIKPQKQAGVLLLPGLCGTPKELGAIPKVLEAAGYKIDIPMIPGYADKEGPINWLNWLDEVEARFESLKAECTTVSVVGLSMGSVLAMALAQRRNDIDGIVLLSPLLRYDGWATPWYHFLIRFVYAIGFRNWSWREKYPYGIANAELRRRVQKAVEQGEASEVGSAFISARHMEAAQLMMRTTRTWLNHIQVPLLVIHAVDDETAAPRNAEEILHRVSSEKRRVVWLGNSYHIITVDNERELVVNETARFIDECRAGVDTKQGFRDRVSPLRLKDRRG